MGDCDREACVQARGDFLEAMDYIKSLEERLRVAGSRGGGGGSSGGGSEDDPGRLFELEQEVTALRDANSRLHDEMDRLRERDAHAREQIQDMQRDLRQAVAARADAEDSVSRMQGQITSYEREIARWVWGCVRVREGYPATLGSWAGRTPRPHACPPNCVCNCSRCARGVCMSVWAWGQGRGAVLFSAAFETAVCRCQPRMRAHGCPPSHRRRDRTSAPHACAEPRRLPTTQRCLTRGPPRTESSMAPSWRRRTYPPAMRRRRGGASCECPRAALHPRLGATGFQASAKLGEGGREGGTPTLPHPGNKQQSGPFGSARRCALVCARVFSCVHVCIRVLVCVCACRLEENAQLREDLRDATMDVENHKAAVAQLTDHVFELESQRVHLETELAATAAARAIADRDLAKVRACVRACVRVCVFAWECVFLLCIVCVRAGVGFAVLCCAGAVLVLRCAVLCCAVLCCAVLYCTALYCAVLCLRTLRAWYCDLRESLPNSVCGSVASPAPHGPVPAGT
jgi:predicted  nucleic acid-binding Zn-ribbon protein